mgnify:CR=1 FL=1
MTITLKIKPDTEEIGEWYRNHYYKHAGDVGLDLFCPDDIELYAGNKTDISFRIACEITRDCVEPRWEKKKYVTFSDWLFSDSYVVTRHIIPDYQNLPYMLIPRSSISKTPLIMTNGVGVIDSSYRGTLRANVLNTSDKIPAIVHNKDRLFQIVLFNAWRINKIEIVDKLSETIRGEAGFGSTGR